ncbi:hypothetical protein PR048_020138 [Dryococelus australis]|uniref:Uncharacterized protein n=1 Tax=Dryococelus australis TaxID=614101 RepID=A0ABQ9H5H0_9NEOP|nr:hypothetical protein PR048_020138 [Dryococelus australis]
MVTLDQSHNIHQVLEQFDMNNAKGLSAPLEVSQSGGVPGEDIDFDDKVYKRAIGCLLYLSGVTRPDIAFTVSKLSRMCSKPRLCDWRDVQHVFRYLRKISDLKLCYYKTDSQVKVFWDADFANDKVDPHSCSGYVILLAGRAVSWCSKRQGVVAQSTVEADFLSNGRGHEGDSKDERSIGRARSDTIH